MNNHFHTFRTERLLEGVRGTLPKAEQTRKLSKTIPQVALFRNFDAPTHLPRHKATSAVLKLSSTLKHKIGGRRAGEGRGRIAGDTNLENSISLQSITPTTLGRVRKTKSRKSSTKVWGFQYQYQFSSPANGGKNAKNSVFRRNDLLR